MTFTIQSIFRSTGASAKTQTSARANTAGNAWMGKFLCSMFLMLAMCSNAWAEKINLNSADAEALQYIPGIGPAKSIDIIELREASEGFKAFDELLDVRGIGEKTLSVIRQYGALDSGVSSLTEEMRANPPKRTNQTAADSSGSKEQDTGGAS